MESYIGGLGAAPFSSVYTCPHAGVSHLLTADAPSIRQTIPVAPLGLAGFDLYVHARKSDPVALFSVTLRGRETDRIYAAWSACAGDLNEDWTTFTLDAGVDVDSDTLEVGIDLKSGAALALGLGPAHPITDAAARANGQPVFAAKAARPLAMRVWQGLPSVPPPTLEGVAPSAAGGVRRFRLPTRSLTSAVILDSQGRPAKDSEDCLRVDESGAVLVQPNGDGAALVLIENACPPGASRVWATFAGASETIDSVQAALRAVKSNGAAPGARCSVSPRDLEALAWTDIHQNRPETLVAEIGECEDGAQSVLLGVRVDDPAKSWFAATRLVAVEIEYLSDATGAALAPGRP